MIVCDACDFSTQDPELGEKHQTDRSNETAGHRTRVWKPSEAEVWSQHPGRCCFVTGILIGFGPEAENSVESTLSRELSRLIYGSQCSACLGRFLNGSSVRLGEFIPELGRRAFLIHDTKECRRKQATPDAKDAEIVRLRLLIDRDRTGLAAALGKVRDVAKSYSWVAESRGPYEWDDDRYKDETGRCLRQVLDIVEKALMKSGDRAQLAFFPPK